MYLSELKFDPKYITLDIALISAQKSLHCSGGRKEVTLLENDKTVCFVEKL